MNQTTIINWSTDAGYNWDLVGLFYHVQALKALNLDHCSVCCLHLVTTFFTYVSGQSMISMISWLAVYLPLWKMMEFVSWDDLSIPNWMESHKSPWFQSPPTRYVSLCRVELWSWRVGSWVPMVPPSQVCFRATSQVSNIHPNISELSYVNIE